MGQLPDGKTGHGYYPFHTHFIFELSLIDKSFELPGAARFDRFDQRAKGSIICGYQQRLPVTQYHLEGRVQPVQMEEVGGRMVEITKKSFQYLRHPIPARAPVKDITGSSLELPCPATGGLILFIY